MKNQLLLLFGICASLASTSQTYFQLPAWGVLKDGSDNIFYYSHLEDSFVYVTEYDLLGSPIWQDSVEIELGVANTGISKILQFGNTSDYLIIFETKAPGLIASPSDSMLCSFIRFNSITQQIVGINTDTLIHFDLSACEVNDTSIYLFQDHYYIYEGFQYPTRTLEIGTDLLITEIAPLDSIEKSYTSNEYVFRNDSLETYPIMGDYSVAKGTFGLDGSNYNEYSYNLVSSSDHNYVDFFKPIGQDSIFLFFQGSSGGTNVNYWHFFLFDDQLNILNSDVGYSIKVYDTFFGGYLYYDRMSQNGVDVINNNIYLLAHLPGSDTIKIFRYDLSFNLECSFNVLGNGHSYGDFIKINNRIYYSSTIGQTKYFFELDDCDFALGNKIDAPIEISFFPNPVSSILTLNVPASNLTQITIYDITGNLVYKTEKTEAAQIQIDVSAFNTGQYLIHLMTEENLFISKFVKI
ncbi:MAG: T9SS type A sorting domain-containing protein [Crocinitomicaceae bacterium]|nr:T9SS type A sorting domain-containing protein [Crocinitomicaceae bacterium]